MSMSRSGPFFVLALVVHASFIAATTTETGACPDSDLVGLLQMGFKPSPHPQAEKAPDTAPVATKAVTESPEVKEAEVVKAGDPFSLLTAPLVGAALDHPELPAGESAKAVDDKAGTADEKSSDAEKNSKSRARKWGWPSHLVRTTVVFFANFFADETGWHIVQLCVVVCVLFMGVSQLCNRHQQKHGHFQGFPYNHPQVGIISQFLRYRDSDKSPVAGMLEPVSFGGT